MVVRVAQLRWSRGYQQSTEKGQIRHIALGMITSPITCCVAIKCRHFVVIGNVADVFCNRLKPH